MISDAARLSSPTACAIETLSGGLCSTAPARSCSLVSAQSRASDGLEHRLVGRNTELDEFAGSIGACFGLCAEHNGSAFGGHDQELLPYLIDGSACLAGVGMLEERPQAAAASGSHPKSPFLDQPPASKIKRRFPVNMEVWPVAGTCGFLPGPRRSPLRTLFHGGMPLPAPPRCAAPNLVHVTF